MTWRIFQERLLFPLISLQKKLRGICDEHDAEAWLFPLISLQKKLRGSVKTGACPEDCVSINFTSEEVKRMEVGSKLSKSAFVSINFTSEEVKRFLWKECCHQILKVSINFTSEEVKSGRRCSRAYWGDRMFPLISLQKKLRVFNSNDVLTQLSFPLISLQKKLRGIYPGALNQIVFPLISLQKKLRVIWAIPLLSVLLLLVSINFTSEEVKSLKRLMLHRKFNICFH